MAVFSGLIVGVLLLPLSAPDKTTDGSLCSNRGGNRTSKYMTYLGCYGSFCFESVTTSTVSHVSDIDQCTNRCKNGGHSFAALAEQTNCSCGNFICERKKVCDSHCGLPCLNADDTGNKICGGKGFHQVYKDTSSSDKHGPIPKLVYLVSAAVCFAIVISTCFICCFYGINRRRHKRRQESRQIENAAVPTDCSSRRARHEGNENIYSAVRPGLHRPVESTNITNGCTASGLDLSSEDTYDHTDSSGRIQSSRNRHQRDQGWQSLPRNLLSGSRGSQRDPSDTQKVTEASEGWQRGNRGFGCSTSKHGATGSCREVMTLGRPWSNQKSTRANCRRGIQKWSPEASTGFVDGGSHIGRGTPRNALKVELVEGQRNDASHQSSLELSAFACKKRGMLALPCNRDTFENTQSGRNGKYVSRTDDGRRHVNPRVEKLGDSDKDMPGSYYHTLESEHEKEIQMDKDRGEPPSSSQYFVEEPTDYSEEPSEVLTIGSNDRKYLEDAAACSMYSEPQYDYAELPEQSSLRFLLQTSDSQHNNHDKEEVKRTLP